MSSDEPLVGEAAEQAAHGYVPMGEVTAPEPESASGDGPLTEWAKRREAEGEARLHTVERNYIQLDGEHAGEPAPENQTLSIERASRDLTNMRAWEAQQAQAEADKRLAVEVDQMRSPLQAPVQQQEHEQKQEAPPVEVQPETPQEVTGADPELVKLITENPKLRTALEAESARVEAARQEYAQGLQRNSAAAYAALFSEYPEVAQLAPGEFPAALKVLAQNNPERARALVEKLQTVNSIVSHWQQEAAQQHQRQWADYQRQWSEWSSKEDAKFDQLVPQLKDEKVKAEVGRAAVETLRGVGFSDDDVRRAWWGDASLSLRDHRSQIILMKAALYDEAQKTAPQKVHRRCRRCSVPEPRGTGPITTTIKSQACVRA